MNGTYGSDDESDLFGVVTNTAPSSLHSGDVTQSLFGNSPPILMGSGSPPTENFYRNSTPTAFDD
eukprot:CAMPEP_0172503000 /NCGR_PEP_ID=MMETSP1066-20121228/164873_1 /TAXON_ID=671091 /ORGANISM="Coscinodiscus wailesii, Strain CCMP2513" /LENGTH=64 /DNA_ID=CAMNT_0013278515 /DNA_START=67 /DNA_END=258 /DNA_ORIENTATION=+